MNAKAKGKVNITRVCAISTGRGFALRVGKCFKKPVFALVPFSAAAALKPERSNDVVIFEESFLPYPQWAGTIGKLKPFEIVPCIFRAASCLHSAPIAIPPVTRQITRGNSRNHARVARRDCRLPLLGGIQ